MGNPNTAFIDFDGTLCDTETDIRLAWKATLADMGLPTDRFDAVFKTGPMIDDVVRALYPDRADAYSWWSYRAAARERNVGWRIDYFLCSNRAAEQIDRAYICPEIMGSDHCPVGLDIIL